MQSVTLDEADSYLGFAAPAWDSHWYPSSGNHVLNSILIRLLTWMFGLSHLSLRAPALLGGAIYVVAAYRLCRLISARRSVAFPLFLCFVYNPFVMDYMVAARGYGLAVGFLMTAVFLAARQVMQYAPGGEAALRRDCAMASMCAALSFSSNFSFAYADGFCILLLWLWTCWEIRSRAERGIEQWWEIASLTAACSIPGLLVTLAIVGSVLRNWPKGQLYYGAHSLTESGISLVKSSFYELNPTIVNPLLESVLAKIRLNLPWLALGLIVAHLAIMGLEYRRRRRLSHRLQAVAVFAGAVVLVTATLHWLQFKLLRIPLPLERTGLFFVPLALLMFGSMTAIEHRGRAGRILQGLSVVVLCLGATYFVGCLRLMYFHEWRFGADVRAAFPVIQEVARRYGTREVAASWHYTSSLDFYRLYFHDTSLEPFRFTEPQTAGKPVYVLSYPDEEEFIRQQKLRIVYRGERSDLTILVRGDPPVTSPATP